MNYQFPRPRLLQLKSEPSWASGFKFKKMLFESVDSNRQRRTTVYFIGSPTAFRSGELKSIKYVQVYMMNISKKSKPNRPYDF